MLPAVSFTEPPAEPSGESASVPFVQFVPFVAFVVVGSAVVVLL